MTLIVSDRVVETSTTTGTGALTLAGAVTGYRRFSAKMSVGDTGYYTIEGIDTSGNPTGEWETGLGTYSSANILTRTTVSDSSNAGAAVNFSAGTKRVFLNLIAAQVSKFVVGGSTPTIRSSNIQSSSASTYTVTWPTGTVVGDLVVIFGGHGFQFSSPPSGWAELDNQQGGNFNGATFAKIMTSGDITTGSVSITTTGAFNGVLVAATITGTTTQGLKGLKSLRSSGGATAVFMIPPDYQTGDILLAFASQRVAAAVTFSSGITALQSINAANASGAFGTAISTLLGETATFGSAGSGYYTSFASFRGA